MIQTFYRPKRPRRRALSFSFYVFHLQTLRHPYGVFLSASPWCFHLPCQRLLPQVTFLRHRRGLLSPRILSALPLTHLQSQPLIRSQHHLTALFPHVTPPDFQAPRQAMRRPALLHLLSFAPLPGDASHKFAFSEPEYSLFCWPRHVRRLF